MIFRAASEALPLLRNRPLLQRLARLSFSQLTRRTPRWRVTSTPVHRLFALFPQRLYSLSLSQYIKCPNPTIHHNRSHHLLSLSLSRNGSRTGESIIEGGSASSAACFGGGPRGGRAGAGTRNGERIDRGGAWALRAASHRHGFRARCLRALRANLSMARSVCTLPLP